jgi:DNA repair protein RadC
LLTASERELRRLLPDEPDLVDQLLLTCRLLDESLVPATDNPLLAPNSESFKRYLKFALGSLRDEHLRIFFTDDAMRLLGEENYTCRSPRYVSFPLRAMMARAMELGATGMVLAHNHPSGLTRPSINDIKLTRSIMETGKALDVRLIDHFVIANMSVRSILPECAQ